MKYNILYLDPPWTYNARRNPGTRFGLGVHGHYPTMTTKEIGSLQIQEILAESAALFLWTTWPRMPDALYVIDAFGFNYKTLGFLWVKLNPRRAITKAQQLAQTLNLKGLFTFLDWLTFFGIGFYAKSCTEPCLLATRGPTLKPITNKISSVIYAPREAHSKKPDIVREKIVELFGDLPRVELFARQATEGWTCLGNEISGKDISTEIVGLQGGT